MNALTAFMLGLIMVFDGAAVFRLFIMGLVFMVTMIMTMNEITPANGLRVSSNVRMAVACEVGALAAFATKKGMDGAQIVAGAIFGGILAQASSSFMRHNGISMLDTNEWALVVYYTIFVVGLALMFNKRGHLTALALLSPALGGAFVASVLSFGATELSANGYAPWLEKVFPDITPARADWIDFLLLVFPGGPDCGLFAGSKYNIFEGAWSTNRAVSVAVASVLFLIGAIVQWRKDKARRLAEKSAARPATGLLEKLIP